jgi:DNA-binding MarR family transcriptional regulator
MDVEEAARLRRALGRIARGLNADASEEGLTPTQASVLGQIAGHGPLGLNDLARREGLNPTMLSRVVGKLEVSGLIVRTQRPDDLRAVQVEVTARGRKLSVRIRDKRTRVLSAYVDRLPDHAAAAIVGALPALEALAEEIVRASQSV